MNKTLTMTIAAAALATAAFAQDQAYIDKATLAAPADNLKAGAMIIKFKPDFTYDVVRPAGSPTALVCFDKSGFPGQQAFSVECTLQGNIKRAAQNMKIEALGDRAKSAAAADAAEKDGSREKPVFGSVWYHLMGADQEHARRHMTIAVPGATAQSMGLPDKGGSGGVWIMNAGTSTAHLMTPGE